MSDARLVVALQAAVPMWIAEAERLPAVARDALLEEWRAHAAEVVPAEGDIILYGGSRKGEAGKAFNALARGLAAVAHAPGGVHLFGLLWCATHSPGGSEPPPLTVCPGCIAEENRGGAA